MSAHQIFDAASLCPWLGMALIRRDHTIIEISSPLADLAGRTREGLLGEELHAIMPESFRDRHRQLVECFLAGDADHVQLGAGRPVAFELPNGEFKGIRIAITKVAEDRAMAICYLG